MLLQSVKCGGQGKKTKTAGNNFAVFVLLRLF
jgi:hypothetical protein